MPLPRIPGTPTPGGRCVRQASRASKSVIKKVTVRFFPENRFADVFKKGFRHVMKEVLKSKFTKHKYEPLAD